MNWNIIFLSTLTFLLKTIRLHANRRNIGVQQLPALLNVTCCVRLHTLLHVIAQSLKPVKLFSQQLPTFLLFCDRRSVAQQCWIRLHVQLFKHCWGHARSLSMVYKDLWVVSFPRCTAGPNIVGSCCIRLHTTANTHATTPNIVSAPMLGVVASVCTKPNQAGMNCSICMPHNLVPRALFLGFGGGATSKVMEKRLGNEVACPSQKENNSRNGTVCIVAKCPPSCDLKPRNCKHADDVTSWSLNDIFLLVLHKPIG